MRKCKRDNLIHAKIDELAKNAIWTMTQPNPAQRITMDQAKKVPYFGSKSDHIQVLCALNEAIINMGKSAEAQSIEAEIDKTFFVIFTSKWKELPFVVPQLLRNSKYSNSLVSLIRYERNLVAHAGQNKEVLHKHFGREVSSEELLDLIESHNPCTIIHTYWAAKRYFNLSSLEHFPPECMEAHQDLMKHLRERLKIQDDTELEKLQKEACPEVEDAKGTSAITPACTTAAKPTILEGHDATIEKFVSQMQETINNTEPEFKTLKADVNKWKAKKENLEKAIQMMRENKRPETDINKKVAELEDVKEKLKTSWILRCRQKMLDSTLYQESKNLFI